MGPAPCEPCASPGGGREGEKPPPGGTPAGGNPRRRQTRRQTAGAGEQPETTEGNRRGSAPGGGWRRAPLAPGVRGQGPGGPSQSEGAPGGPPPEGQRDPPPQRGAGDRCPGVRKRARPHLAGPGRIPMIVCGTLAARKRSAEGWGGCAPTVGPDGPGPNAAPVSGPDGRTGEAGEERGPGEGPRRTRIRAAWRPGDLSRRARGPGGLAALPRGCQSPRTARRGQERTGRTVHAALTMRASEGRRRSRRTVPRSAVGGPGCTAENLPKCHGPLPGPPLLDNRTLFHQYF